MFQLNLAKFLIQKNQNEMEQILDFTVEYVNNMFRLFWFHSSSVLILDNIILILIVALDSIQFY